MNRRILFKSAAVFLTAYLALLVLSLQFGHRLADLLLPIYRWEIGYLMPDYQILSMGLQDNRGESVIAMNLKLVHTLVVEGRMIFPGGHISCSTLAGHTLQNAVLMLSLLAAWPANIYRRFVMLMIAAPILLLVEMLDTPLMLAGSINDLILANVAPYASSLSVYWMHFLDGGGRLALSIFGALLAVGIGKTISRLTPVQRSLMPAV